ncbi:MAG: CoB--CoM heterodisulfide reductase iron-sulfur subunit B family protein [Planctomycetota bacterium]|jgi:heterodisulfide reductase subunit B
MKYAYYPGCSLLSSAAEYARSGEAVLEAMGVELEEIDDWVCCGATAAHATSHLLSVALPAISCAEAEKKGLDVLTCCAACYSRLKQTNQQVKEDPELQAQISEIIEEPYQGNVRVLHISEVLARELDPGVVATHVVQPLKGLKVACYYGCLMARMPESLRIDAAEYPTMLDELMRAVGAEPVDWPFKTECCGAALTLAQQATVKRLSAQIVQIAKENGADVLAVACPLCQANLDMYQADAEKALGEQLGIPVLYFTQLIGLAMGLGAEQLCLEKGIVDPLPLLVEKGFIAGEVYL